MFKSCRGHQNQKQISMKKIPQESSNLIAANRQNLKQIFPEIFCEDQIDFQTLKQLLGEKIIDDETQENQTQEKYGLNWSGKSQARQFSLSTSLATLRPKKSDSVNWQNTKNLMIEGDNLEVLKLLQKSYAAKIKMIYIDPPYNTGKDFVYPDDYAQSIQNYKKISGQTDEEGFRNQTNQESSGRFHTDWLNMIYPRLKLARNLLMPDGVIFISIDDHEVANLRKVCDEIFGEENFIAQLVWQQGRKSIAAQIANNHEYCLIFCKDRNFALQKATKENRQDWMERKNGLEEIYKIYETSKKQHQNNFEKIEADLKNFFSAIDENQPAKAHQHYNKIDKNGIYFAGDISQGTSNGGRFDILHPITKKPCKVPNGGWRFAQEKMAILLAEEKIHFGLDHETVPCFKRYLKETESEVAPSVFYRDGRGASKRLIQLMEGEVFDFPKDEQIIAKFLRYITQAKDESPIILDFFAGSGTTAHAVMAQNALDGGNRRFILVQLPEILDEKNKDQKAAAEFCDKLNKPKNIAELTKERLRRAGEKIKNQNPLFAGDLGFRCFALDESNIKPWQIDEEDIEKSLEENCDQLLLERSDDDILCEVFLKNGLDLSCQILSKKLPTKSGELEIFADEKASQIVCLTKDLNLETAEELAIAIVKWHQELTLNAAQKPQNCNLVFRDSAFLDDVVKTNFLAILNQAGFTQINSL